MPALIPKVVHRIWFGPHQMRDELVEYGKSWERHGYEVKLWTEDNLPPLRCQRVYDEIGDGRPINVGGGVQELGVWVQRADVVAYELVSRFGGIVANTDIECLRPLDPILDGVSCFAGYEDDIFLCNALMGATPRHEFFDLVLEELPRRWDSLQGEPMNGVTGPHFLTFMGNRHSDLIERMPREWFYPYSYTEMDREHLEHPEAYTSHHWGHTRRR